MATWKLRVDADEALLYAVRRHLTTDGRSRVSLQWHPEQRPLTALVLDSGKLPALPQVALGPAPAGPAAARGPWELPAQADWVVVVDDTGSGWVGPKPDGRLVALALGAGATVPALPRGFHATSDQATATAALDHVLRAPIGVLGLRAAAVPDLGSEERWRVALIALLERVLLLLPVPAKGAVGVTVIVEQHSGVAAGDDMSALAEAVLLALRRAQGPGARSITLAIHVVKKDQHRAMAMADAMAWAWCSRDATGAEPLALHRAHGVLPAPGAGDEVVDAIPAALGAAPFDAGLWRRLCAWAEREQTPGLATHLRDRYEARLRAHPAELEAAVEANQALLYSRRFDAALLRREAASLARLGRRREDEPAVQLGLAAALRADQNRRGHLIDPDQAEAERFLAHALLDELPTEAAELCLRLAVAHMNGLDWDAAEATLPPAGAPLPLVVRGRVESTRGQIAANRGLPAVAAEHFDAAQALFAQMRSPERAAEARHTGAYQLSNRWALPPGRPTAERLAVAARLDLGPEALRSLLVRSDPGAAWAQLDLLRWVAARPRDTGAERGALVAVAARVPNFAGHPWPLIGLYRCVVLRAADAEPDSLGEALDLHAQDAEGLDAGPALQLIAAGIEVHRLSIREERRSPRLERLTQQLHERLPRATPWLEKGRALLDAGADWAGGEWLPELLPFSMR